MDYIAIRELNKDLSLIFQDHQKSQPGKRQPIERGKILVEPLTRFAEECYQPFGRSCCCSTIDNPVIAT